MANGKKSAKRVAEDPNRLTYDYASNRLSDEREAVVVSDHATIKSPFTRNGKPATPFNTDAVVQLMVEGDDTPLFTCRRGDYVSNNAHGVYMHTTHHDRVYASVPRYSEETIKLVLRLHRQYKHDRVKNYNEATADDLNKRGIKSYSGLPWTNQMVHHIVQDYGATYRTRLWKRRDTPHEFEKRAATVTADAVEITEKIVHHVNINFPDDPNARITAVYDSMQVVLDDVVRYAQRIAERVTDMHRLIAVAQETKSTPVTPLIDEEELAMLRRKAAKFDRLFSLASED
jgi:hypothetical protein